MERELKMGLDITAYEQAEIIETLPDIETWGEKYYFNDEISYLTDYIHSQQEYPEHLAGIVEHGVYRCKETYDFRAGGYGAYNHWREVLSKLILHIEPRVIWNSPDEYRNQPFFWLINFTDCDGIIGTEKCQILAADFQKWQEAAENYTDTDDHGWFLETYKRFRRAFEMAAENGYVEFH